MRNLWDPLVTRREKRAWDAGFWWADRKKPIPDFLFPKQNELHLYLAFIKGHETAHNTKKEGVKV